MAAVGLWAAIRGGKAVWAWPLAFLSAMAAGGAFGLGNASLPLVEPVVLASAIILGGLTAAATKAPLAAGAGLVALFGLAHGYAHGLEAPAGPAVTYAAGFLLATASLVALGLAVGLGLLRIERPNLLRLLGAAAALCGLAVVLA
jgi:urease accessory protein